MVFLILRDAITLFLLVYAVLDLAHHLLRFLSHALLKTEPKVDGTYILYIDNLPAESTENIIRSVMQEGRNLLLVTNSLNTETFFIAERISKTFPYVHIITKQELADWLKSETMTSAFVTHDIKANLNPNK